MPKAISSIAVISVLIGLCLAPVRAQTAGEREIDAIRQDVSRLYSADRKVSVKTRSGVKIVGYIDQVGLDTFTLRTSTSKTELRYEQVASVSQKSGLTKNQKTALVIGAVAAVVVVAAVFGRKKRSGGFNPPCLLC